MSDEPIDWQRRRQMTIRNTIALMEEVFVDTPWMSSAPREKIPSEILDRVHTQIRHGCAHGGAS